MTKTILIFDREAIALRLLRFALELQDFRVIESGDPFEAFDALSAARPDLLVIGLEPSGACDHELADNVRRRPDLAGLPILFMGERQCMDQVNLQLIGNCAWLGKPFRMRELHGLVESMLSVERLSEDCPDQWPIGASTS